MTSKTLGEDTKKVLSSEAFRFVSFVVTGGISAACNLVARFWMSRVMRYEFAVLFAYLVGMIVAFVLARTFVFDKSERDWQQQLARFAVAPARAASHRQVESARALRAAGGHRPAPQRAARQRGVARIPD